MGKKQNSYFAEMGYNGLASKVSNLCKNKKKSIRFKKPKNSNLNVESLILFSIHFHE
jgi:hypothetical protein